LLLEIVKLLTAICDKMKVVIEIGELGIISGVRNGEEVSNQMKKSIEQIKSYFNGEITE
jgi:fructose/tagatose bisphosphate aldolase